jgi:hypothetical protein
VGITAEKSSVLGTTATEGVVGSPENSAVIFRAIIEFAGDKDIGNKRGAIGRVYAEKQRE